MQTDDKKLNDYLDIVGRRWKGVVLAAITIFSLTAIVTLIMPPTYKSTSTVLIEEQNISRDYIVSTVAGYAEQRLQEINQRVMSSTKLLEIIDRYNLYSERRKVWPSEKIVEKMRKDIKMETISAEVDDPRAGRSAKVTIAFTITYLNSNPSVAQQIANVLASLYLEENLKVRGQLSDSAAMFFEEEMRKTQARMAELDGKIAAYKDRNIDALPDNNMLNFQELARIDLNVDQMNNNLRALLEKESSLKTQLEGIPSTEEEMKNKAYLNELRVRLVNLRTRVSDEYPDVLKLKQEIAELEKKQKAQGKEATADSGDSLSYVTLSGQLTGARAEIESIRKQLGSLARKRDDYRRRIAASPRVEEGYRALVTERNNVHAKYDDLSKKYMDANVVQGLEKGQMGERFTLIDPARLPEMPVRPNIPVFLLAGLVLGVSTGAGVAALKEAGDRAVYTVDALARAVSVPLIVGIPEIVTQKDIDRKRKRRNLTIIVTVLVVIVAIAAFHFLVMDLDVFWAKLQRRLVL